MTNNELLLNTLFPSVGMETAMELAFNDANASTVAEVLRKEGTCYIEKTELKPVLNYLNNNNIKVAVTPTNNKYLLAL